MTSRRPVARRSTKAQKSSLDNCSATSLVRGSSPWPAPEPSWSLASGQWCQKIWFGALLISASQSFHGKSTVSVLAACSLCARPPPLFWSLLRLAKPSARANSSVSPGSSDAQAATSWVVKPRSFAPCNSHGSSRRDRPSRISTALALKGPAHQRIKRSEVRSTLSPKAGHKSQPLEERNRSSAPISRSRRTTSLGALPAASGFLAISTA